MNLAIVFWLYKEPEVCKNRLELLKKYNPGVKICGLYCGAKEQEEFFKVELGDLLDHFYTTSFSEKDSNFKWIHGDVMILDWYKNCGINLQWDSVAVVQWDLLVLDSLKNIFSDLQKDDFFLSGQRTLDIDLENRWHWTNPENAEERNNFDSFKKYVDDKYQYRPETYPCCLFIFQILPRVFFEKWTHVSDPYIGMLEYKIPAYAEIFEMNIYQKKTDLGVYWSDRPEPINELPMNAWPQEISDRYIQQEAGKNDGYRMFHPYFKIW